LDKTLLRVLSPSGQAGLIPADSRSISLWRLSSRVFHATAGPAAGAGGEASDWKLSIASERGHY
ncbi:MAG: hypothetical protein Q8932_20470, partial [Bacteroidota bacterium]|nr:hypothetical protein [Bacteroidota bacterium]